MQHNNLDFELHFFARFNILLVKPRIRVRLFVNRAPNKHCIKIFKKYSTEVGSIIVVIHHTVGSSSVFSQKVVTRHNCVLSKQPIKSLN